LHIRIHAIELLLSLFSSLFVPLFGFLKRLSNFLFGFCWALFAN
jgi:hypothetical protein